MLSLILEIGLPVSYLNHGQNVPDDFSIASQGSIVQLLIEGKKKKWLTRQKN
jgi:flagellar biosynthesis GTPase FlhF